MTKVMSATLFALIATFASAQSDTRLPTFATKGQEWEYRNYMPYLGMFIRRDDREVTTFVYKVVVVKDSAGSSYCHIIKTGTAAKNPEHEWHRDFVVRVDSQSLTLPVDYYLNDTVFQCDFSGGAAMRGVGIATQLSGDSLWYPSSLDSTASLPLTEFFIQQRVHDPAAAMYKADHPAGMPGNYKIKSKGAIISRNIVGVQKIRTQAGEFVCLHIHLHVQYEKPRIANDIDEFYCPTVGLVRSQDKAGNLMELTRVRKKR